MRLDKRLGFWLDIRPGEGGGVFLAFAGSFFMIGFVVLSRSLREALFLTHFGVETIPYIWAAAALLGIPLVAAFTRLLSALSPWGALRVVAIAMAAGVGAVSPWLGSRPEAVIAFYLVTALGTLLLTTGFWVVMTEVFALREAKRLFGYIGAGGTAGAMVTGSLVNWAPHVIHPIYWTPVLIGLLLSFVLFESLLQRAHRVPAAVPEAPATAPAGGAPAARNAATPSADHRERSPFTLGLSLIRGHAHLRALSLIVFTVAVASTIIDYQFKSHASARFTSQGSLIGFLGGFYGWTGAAAFAVQVLLTARLLGNAGIGNSLALLPGLVLIGSAALFAAPSLVTATLVRGADDVIRKSLHRSAVEVLYVPLPVELRRKTKALIDSVVDGAGVIAAAVFVFVWIKPLSLTADGLSLPVIMICASLLGLSRSMGRVYIETVTRELRNGVDKIKLAGAGLRLPERDLWTTTLTRLELRSILGKEHMRAVRRKKHRAPAPVAGPPDPARILETGDTDAILKLLAEKTDWAPDGVPLLARLLARDDTHDAAAAALSGFGPPAASDLGALLRSERADFVIRRRIPKVLSVIDSAEADDALIDGLRASRFEVRYRCAMALSHRRRHGLPESPRDWRPLIWEAVRSEVNRGRPLWELNKLLDSIESDPDDLVAKRVGARGERSIEHTFRLLMLVLDPRPVRAAYYGILLNDAILASLSLEFLEHVLPADVREKLWPFIGDVNEHRKARGRRPLDDVVSALLETKATIFPTEEDRETLIRLLAARPAGPSDDDKP